MEIQTKCDEINVLRLHVLRLCKRRTAKCIVINYLFYLLCTHFHNYTWNNLFFHILILLSKDLCGLSQSPNIDFVGAYLNMTAIKLMTKSVQIDNEARYVVELYFLLISSLAFVNSRRRKI